MEIKEFKKWLIDKSLDDNELFLESIRCFQVEAYKAAYLYSYLSYIDYIKELILEYRGVPKKFLSNKPYNHRLGKWRQRIQKLESEDLWEENTMNFIKEGKDTNIFELKDSIRNEFLQKKDLRNTAVHNKDRAINISTVEELWSFINYSYDFFVINGSVDVLKEEIENFIKFGVLKGSNNNKISDILKTYKSFEKKDRRDIFDFIINYINSPLGDVKKNFIMLLNEIFKDSKVEEYKWIIDNNLKILLYVIIPNIRFDFLFNEFEVKKIIYENIDISRIIEFGENEKNNELLNLIFDENYSEKWYEVIKNILLTNYNLFFNIELLQKINSTGFVKSGFLKIKDELLHQTLTEDHLGKYIYIENDIYIDFFTFIKNFDIIILVLLFWKNGVSKDIVYKDLVERCSSIVKLENNGSKIYTSLKQYPVIFDWLKQYKNN